MDRIDFTVNIDGTDIELSVVRPNLKQRQAAKKVSNEAFFEAIKHKAPLRDRIDEVLREQGMWNDEKQARFTELQEKLLENERILTRGNKKITKKDARKLALEMRGLRAELRDLLFIRGRLEARTAEGQADDAAFQSLVSSCVVYKSNGQAYFKNLEDYLERSNDPAALQGAQHLNTLEYGDTTRYESQLPEIKFLKRFKFMDDKLRLIREDGKFVDEEGKLIDENGRYISEKGEFVDKDGNPVDEEGNYSFEFVGFADEDGDAEKRAVAETKEVEAKTEEQLEDGETV